MPTLTQPFYRNWTTYKGWNFESTSFVGSNSKYSIECCFPPNIKQIKTEAFPTFCSPGNEMLRLLNGTIVNHQVVLLFILDKNRHRYNHSQDCFLVHTTVMSTCRHLYLLRLSLNKNDPEVCSKNVLIRIPMNWHNNSFVSSTSKTSD